MRKGLVKFFNNFPSMDSYCSTLGRSLSFFNGLEQFFLDSFCGFVAWAKCHWDDRSSTYELSISIWVSKIWRWNRISPHLWEVWHPSKSRGTHSTRHRLHSRGLHGHSPIPFDWCRCHNAYSIAIGLLEIHHWSCDSLNRLITFHGQRRGSNWRLSTCLSSSEKSLLVDKLRRHS